MTAPVVVFGPTPDGFSELQGRWLDAMIQLGGKSREAAIAAGYSQGGAENIGIRNLANPKMQAELLRRVKLQSGSALASAVGRLLAIVENPLSDDKAAVQAALGLMDRFGMAAPKGTNVAVQVNMNGGMAQTIIKEVHEMRQARLTQPDGV